MLRIQNKPIKYRKVKNKWYFLLPDETFFQTQILFHFKEDSNSVFTLNKITEQVYELEGNNQNFFKSEFPSTILIYKSQKDTGGDIVLLYNLLYLEDSKEIISTVEKSLMYFTMEDFYESHRDLDTEINKSLMINETKRSVGKVQILLPDGYVLKTKVSIDLPIEVDTVSIQRLPTNRSKWKFWLPKFVYQYQIMELI